MASIDPRANSWALQWRLGGTATGSRQTLTFPIGDADPDVVYDLVLAAKKLVESRRHGMTRDQLAAAVLGDPAGPVGVPTFKEWMDAWLAKRRMIGDIEPDTIDGYEQVLRLRALPFLGHRQLTEITHETIEEWVAWMRGTCRLRDGERLAAETMRRAHSVLHGCLGAAVPKWIPANPATSHGGTRRGYLPKDDQDPFEGVFLTPAEILMILKRCPPSIYDLVFVAVRTGLRLSELLALRRQDVDLAPKNPRIRVKRALKRNRTIGSPKSHKSRRDVSVSAEVRKVLAARMVGLKPADLLFASPRGGIWWETALRNYHWRPAVAAAQRCEEHPPPLPPKPARGRRRGWRLDEVSTCLCESRLQRGLRFHDLRHTHASLLIEEGWEPKRIQERLGHATLKETMDRYGHLWPTGDGKRLEGLEKTLREPRERVPVTYRSVVRRPLRPQRRR